MACPVSTDLVKVKMIKLTRRQSWPELLTSNSYVNSSGTNVTIICQDGTIDWNMLLLAQWSAIASSILEAVSRNCCFHDGLTILLPETKVDVLEKVLSWSIRGEVWLSIAEVSDVSNLMLQLQVNVPYHHSIDRKSSSVTHNKKQETKHYDNKAIAGASFNDLDKMQDTSENKNFAELEGSNPSSSKSVDPVLEDKQKTSAEFTKDTVTQVKKPNYKDFSNGTHKVRQSRRTREYSKKNEEKAIRQQNSVESSCRFCKVDLSLGTFQDYVSHMTTHFRNEIMDSCHGAVKYLEDGKGFHCTLCRETFYRRKVGPLKCAISRHLSEFHLKVLDHFSEEQLRFCLDKATQVQLKDVIRGKLQRFEVCQHQPHSGGASAKSEDINDKKQNPLGTHLPRDQLKSLTAHIEAVCEDNSEALPAPGDDDAEKDSNSNLKQSLKKIPSQARLSSLRGKRRLERKCKRSFKTTLEPLTCHLCPDSKFEILRDFFEHLSKHFAPDIKRQFADAIQIVDEKSFNCSLCGHTYRQINPSLIQSSSLRHISSVHLKVLDFLPEEQLRLCLHRAKNGKMRQILKEKLKDLDFTDNL